MDLWAKSNHHDDESPPLTGTAEHERTHSSRKVRRLTDGAILSLFRTWLLDDYVPDYCRSLASTRIFKRCYWIDALGTERRRISQTTPTALPALSALSALAADANDQAISLMEPIPKGKRRKNATPAVVPPDLQPVISLSETLARGSKPIHLRGFMLEEGSSKRSRHASLREQARGQREPAHIPREIVIPTEGGLIRASWLEASSDLLREIEQSPAIFLLNPLGPTLFSYDDLAPLYQRTVPTELCLLLPHKQIEARLPAAHKNQILAATLTGLLRTNRWKSLPTGAEKRHEEIAGFLDLFLASMQRHFPIPPQRITLSAPTGPASIAPLPYTLIYATRRQDSLLIMNDAVCLYQRRVYQESYQGVLSEEWFARQEREHHEIELQLLAPRIRQQGAASRIRRWPDLRQQLILANFGQFTQSEYDTIMRQLIFNKEVQCTWRIPPGESGERVPGIDDSLQWK